MMAFLGQTGGIGSIISTLMFILFIFFYPRIMMWQLTFKLDEQVRELGAYSRKAEEIVAKKVNKKPDKNLKKSIHSFMNFFVVSPVDLDPFGIIRKLEHVIDESEARFRYFINQLAPKQDEEIKANMVMGLKGALVTTQIYKIIRHYVITIKKTNNMQLALILQMSMPMIMKLAKSELKATKAMTEGIPVGDGIGPLVVASHMSKNGKEIAEDVVMSKESIYGKNVYFIKAKGVGGRLGKIGIASEKLVKKEKIGHIITIDAGLKFEGEKSGEIAEGIGVAMGGVGVQRSKIENVAIKNNLPLDAIVIKVALSEAIEPMTKDIYNSLGNARESLKKRIIESKKRKILVIGVGNTVGIGNKKDSLKGFDVKLRPIWRKQAKQKEKEKKYEM